jgi:formate/nitrite transporter
MASLDLSKTIYVSTMKSPKDAYVAFAEKGAANAKMAKRKIFHQAVLGGCYVGFGALVSLSIAGNVGGIGAANPGIPKMLFAALFPVNLLLIATTGGQLFTGNSATVASARFEGLVDNYEMFRNLWVALIGNVVGCSIMAFAAHYVGLLKGGTAALCASTALTKCTSSFGTQFVKAVLCNWMVSIAVFLSGASNDLTGKLVGVWFPISTFVAIGLEHSVANMFIMPAALLLKVPLTIGDVLFRNIIPVLLGNAVAGGLVVAGSYSYQFGRLGGKRRAIFAEQLKARELRKRKQSIKDQAASELKGVN